MRGFDNKALVLFPEHENYMEKSVQYRQQFRMAYANLLKYLEDCHIEPISFYTDDIARDIALPGTKWATPLTMAESFFASTKCTGMALAMKCSYDFPEIMAEAEKKYPTNLDASDGDKLNVIMKHVKFVTERAIKQYKIVIQFKSSKNNQYKVDKGENEQKIRVYVDTRAFTPTAFLCGAEEDCVALLGTPYANRSLLNWGLV